MSLICGVFKECVRAIRDGELIEREGRNDKEFHFQNWFKGRPGADTSPAVRKRRGEADFPKDRSLRRRPLSNHKNLTCEPVLNDA